MNCFMEDLGVSCVYNFALRKHDFRGGDLQLSKIGGGQLHTKDLIMVVTCKMCLFSLYLKENIGNEMLYGRKGSQFCTKFALRKHVFRGRWYATLKNRGRSTSY